MSSLRSERGVGTVLIFIIIVAVVLLYMCSRDTAAPDKTVPDVINSLVWLAAVCVVCYTGYKLSTVWLQHKNEQLVLKEEAEARARLRREMGEQDRKYVVGADKKEGGDNTT